jgi:valyl-tRNA synthetase
MIASVKNGQIEIVPERFERVYDNWIENLRDWCISRQIWFGHRIPVWYRGEEIYCGMEAPEGDGWEQDSDTLDTWFSSGLWSFSTLGWPNQTEDFKTYHPLSIMETAYDIIFFWVARMILMTTYLLGDIPFKKVYLHGLVRDGQGRKMSKSLGNIIDPLDMTAKYGTDALRIATIIGTAPGADSKLSEDKIRGYKNFANKLWNITRFVMTSNEDFSNSDEIKLTETDQKYLTEFETLKTEITAHMENLRFYLAGEQLYAYVWHTFADAIIEESKERLKSEDAAIKQSTQKMLQTILRDSIKMLHPFMPFITEEIWSIIKLDNESALIISPWPNAESK